MGSIIPVWSQPEEESLTEVIIDNYGTTNLSGIKLIINPQTGNYEASGMTL